jgi:hypothetical protein
VPYLLLGLQDVQWTVGNSRGARKLARTPHVNQKKKKKYQLCVWDPPNTSKIKSFKQILIGNVFDLMTNIL